MEKSWNCVFEFLWKPCITSVLGQMFHKFIVPRLCGKKLGDMVFGFPSFLPFFHPSFHPSSCPSIPLQVVGTLCMQLLLQFYFDSFDTLKVFSSWSKDVHIVWI